MYNLQHLEQLWTGTNRTFGGLIWLSDTLLLKLGLLALVMTLLIYISEDQLT